MRKINFLLLLALAGSAYGEEWRPLPDTTLTQLLDSRWANKAGYLGEGHLFRCIDYFDVDMRHTGHRCFEFREAGDE